MCCRIKQFCCFEVATAVVILGWLGLTGSIILVIAETITLGNIESYSIEHSGLKIDASVLTSIIGVDLSFNVINLLTSAFLVLGAMKRNRLMLIPWMLRSMINIVLTCILATIGMLAIMTSSDGDFGAFFAGFLICCIVIGLPVYCWSAVYSLYKDLKETEMDSLPIQLIPKNAYNQMV